MMKNVISQRRSIKDVGKKMIQAYEKNELKRVTKNRNLNELDKFVFNNIGNGKVFKLRKILEEIGPIFLVAKVGTRGHEILLKLRTWIFPDGEERVGIEFVKKLD